MSSNITSVVDSLWPTDSCDQFSARPVLPDTTSPHVCGLQTNNASLLDACCDGGTVRQYQCWMFCSYSGGTSVQRFGECIQEQYGGNSPGSSVFCEGGVVSSTNGSAGNGTEDAETSFGGRRYSSPRLSWIVLAVLFSIFFIGPTSATILPPSQDLSRRQSSSTDCTFDIEKNFVRAGRQTKVSASTRCSSNSTCWQTEPIDTGIDSINRTINGNSAADSTYDAFFDIVSNATQGRTFPAQSRLQMNYSFGVAGGSEYFVTFVPYYWCVNGTATNCDGVYGTTDDAQHVTACGPLYVEDATSDSTAGLNGSVVQGSMRVVQTG